MTSNECLNHCEKIDILRSFPSLVLVKRELTLNVENRYYGISQECLYQTVIEYSFLSEKQVKVYDNSSVLHSNITTNGTTTAITLRNLTTGIPYKVKAEAFTHVGVGPATPFVGLLIGKNWYQFLQLNLQLCTKL